MVRENITERLSTISKTPIEFNFDNLFCNYKIGDILSWTDICDIGYIATSVKYMGKVKDREKYINDIMIRRGFRKFHAGTNRTCYVFLDDSSFIAKTPLDKNGMDDNLAEYTNQGYLRPFCTKIYDVTKNGEISFSERVTPIRTRKEFASIADSYFDLIVNKIIGRYVVDDIGSSSYMNTGVRIGFGPVLLDYPRVYKLDGSKLRCNKQLPNNTICNGEIDYDIKFDDLVCTQCGKVYNAKQLSQDIEEENIILDKGEIDMKVKIYKGNKLIAVVGDSSVESKSITKEVMPKIYKGNKLINDIEEPVFENDDEPIIEEDIDDTSNDEAYFASEKAKLYKEDPKQNDSNELEKWTDYDDKGNEELSNNKSDNMVYSESNNGGSILSKEEAEALKNLLKPDINKEDDKDTNIDDQIKDVLRKADKASEQIKLVNPTLLQLANFKKYGSKQVSKNHKPPVDEKILEEY